MGVCSTPHQRLSKGIGARETVHTATGAPFCKAERMGKGQGRGVKGTPSKHREVNDGREAHCRAKITTTENKPESEERQKRQNSVIKQRGGPTGGSQIRIGGTGSKSRQKEVEYGKDWVNKTPASADERDEKCPNQHSGAARCRKETVNESQDRKLGKARAQNGRMIERGGLNRHRGGNTNKGEGRH